MYKKIGIVLLMTQLALLAACDGGPSENNNVVSERTSIVTVNYPLFYFSQQLAGDFASVTLPVPAEGDPAQWQPQVDDMANLQSADLVVFNGAGYSPWRSKVSLQQSKIVDASAALTSQLIKLTKQETHSHGPTGEHSHDGYAFTTWMDLELARQQVKAIADAMILKWPHQKASIQQNQEALLAELSAIDEMYQTQAKMMQGKAFIYSHPVYQYFERRYSLAGHSVHWEPNVMPPEEEWATLEKLVEADSNALFIWEDEPMPEIAQRMSKMGLETIVIKPAANRTELGWLEEQQRNAQNMQDCCQK